MLSKPCPRLTYANVVSTACLFVVLGGTSLAACGDDDDEGPSTQEFIAQADAICQEADKKQAAVRGSGSRPGIEANFSNGAFLARYNAVTRDALKRLRALDAPEAERKAFDGLVSAVKGSVAAVDKRIAALRARDLARQSEAARELERSYGDIAVSAGTVGLSQCQGLSN